MNDACLHAFEVTIRGSHSPLPDDIEITIMGAGSGASKTYVRSQIGELVTGDNQVRGGSGAVIVPKGGFAADSSEACCTWSDDDWGPNTTSAGALDARATGFSPVHLELAAHWTVDEDAFCHPSECEYDRRQVMLEPL